VKQVGGARRDRRGRHRQQPRYLRHQSAAS
jgi:hypothetical protein